MFHLFFTKKFNSHIWKSNPEKRNQYVKAVLRTGLVVGKSEEEIESIFGPNESCSRKDNRWTYALYSDYKAHKKYFLSIYFQNGKALMARKEFKTLY